MNKPSTDTKKLISALREDNTDAYQQLYLLYYEKLCRYVFSLSNDQTEVEDVVQELFIDIWKKRKSIEITTSLNSYLYKVAHNKYIDQYRKTQRKNTFIDELRQEAIIAVEDMSDDVKEKRLLILQQAIELLPPKRKEIFILNKLKNYKYREVAAQLNISERTVESQIRKALIFIREQIKHSITVLLLLLFT